MAGYCTSPDKGIPAISYLLGLSNSDLTKCLGRLINAVGCPEFAVCFQCVQFAFGHGFKNVVVRGYTMENENVIGKVCFAILRKGLRPKTTVV